MNIFKRSNKLIFACFLLVIAVLLGGAFINPSHAAELDNVIDSIDIKYSEDNDVINKGDIFSIYAEWSLEDGQAQAGDTFEVDLDGKLDTSLIKGSLTLIAEDGEVYAIGEIDENKLIFTFTNAVEDKINIKGHFEIQGLKLDIENPDADKGIEQTEIEIDGKTTTIKYDNGSYDKEITEPGKDQPNRDKSYEKHGHITKENSNLKNSDMYWMIYVNAKGDEERTNQPIKISDKLEPGHSIVPGSLSLRIKDKSNINENTNINGGYIYDNRDKKEEFNQYIEDLYISEDGKSYSLTFNPGENKKALIIYYNTEIDEDADPTQYIFENKVNITTGNEFETIIPEEVRYYKMLGTAQGENINKGSLEVMKVDEDGNPIKQDEATFRLKRNVEEEEDALGKSPEEFETTETTNEEGIAVFQGLESGLYILEEVSAPEGYLLSKKSKEIVLNFKNNNETIETTFENKAVEKTDYRISKEWDIPEGINLDDLDDESLKANFDLYKIMFEYDKGKINLNNGEPTTNKSLVNNSRKTISLKDGDTDIVWSDLDAKDQYGNPIRYIAKEYMDESIFELSVEESRYNNPKFINKLKLEPLIPDKPEEPKTPDKPEDKEKPDPEDPVEPLIPEDPYEPGKPTDPDIPKDHPKQNEQNDPKESKDLEKPIISEKKEVSSHVDIDNDLKNEIEVGMLNDTVIDNDFETTSKDEEGPIDLLPQTGEKFRYPFYIIGLLFLALGLRVRKTK